MHCRKLVSSPLTSINRMSASGVAERILLLQISFGGEEEHLCIMYFGQNGRLRRCRRPQIAFLKGVRGRASGCFS
jgi:hypothetical protein